MKNVLILLSLLFPSAAFADDIRFAPSVTVTAAVTLVADENGVLQLDRSQPILIGSVVATVPVDPTDPVVPIEPTDPLAVKVSALIASAPTGATEANARKTIAELYKMTGQLPLTDPADIRKATTLLFDALPMSEAWKTWRVNVHSFAAGLGIADVKRSWKLISEGLAK